MPQMRAKLQVGFVQSNKNSDGVIVNEVVNFHAVCKSGGYPADGKDEDNSFARWSPSANLSICIANPDLFGKHEAGQKYYVDFTPAPDPVA